MPASSVEDVAMESGATMAMVKLAEIVLAAASLSWTEKVDVPDDVAVPDTKPAGESVKPDGGEPDVFAHL